MTLTTYHLHYMQRILQIVTTLIVLVQIETFCLLILGNTKSKCYINQLQKNEGHNGGIDTADEDTHHLNADLVPHRHPFGISLATENTKSGTRE